MGQNFKRIFIYKEIIMSIISKEERRLSLKHWRYRLLHWCFNVEPNPGSNITILPKFLYTHYCPLFHLTNLIAILLPFIILIKILVQLFVISADIADNLRPKSNTSASEIKILEIKILIKILKDPLY